MAVLFSKIVGYTASAGGAALLLGFLNIIKPLRVWARAIVYVALIVVFALLGAIEGVVLTLLGRQGLSQWVTARSFYFACRYILRYKVEIHDPHNYLGSTRPAVFVANHQSELDILLLGATFPKWCSVTAKKALKYYPFLGWFMTASGSVFVDRAKKGDPSQAFRLASKQVLEHRQSVFMFPEGTRSYAKEPTLLPFKKGAFHFAQQAQIPVVPYVISNYSNVWSIGRRVSQPGIIRVEVLKPIEMKGLSHAEVGEVTERTRKEMLDVAKRLGYATPF